MAGLIVAGSFLSGALNVLFDRMASKQVIDFLRATKLDENVLKKLEIELRSAKRVVNDAEKKQLTDPDVREWLHQLREAIYDAEDLVYEINTEAGLSQPESSRSGSLTLFQVPNIFSSSRFTVLNIEQRIDEIHSMLKFIVEKKDVLGLREGGLESRPFPRVSEAPLVDDSDIYGRDADKEAILKFLLSEEVGGGDNKVSVIPIVGMGGIGKTTLAQLVYRDIDRHAINKRFEIKAWITVSEESDVFTLTKTIYEAVTKKTLDSCIKQLFELQLQLEELLRNKKILFVFDDVWNLNYQRWSDLKAPLESAAYGSKIIVTTRSAYIASVMGSVSGHELQVLPEENCWRLFAKHVFSNGESSGLPDLEEIGRKIVKKCKGLPLAIKSLGCLLHCERNPKEWENILKNDIWDLPEMESGSGILPALWLSYYYLSPHLKRCFAYCSLFPKDYNIEKGKLIRMWMAEDLLQPQKNKTLEEVGEEYCKDLTSRSFFREDDGEFIMHDLVNDLANFVSGESCLRLDENYSEDLLRKTRYLSITGYKVDDMKKIEEISKNKVLRTLLVLNGRSRTLHEHYKKYPEQLQSMRCLRVLSAFQNFYPYEQPHVTKLLSSIGGLKLLRYLDLSSNYSFKEVPETICTLYNLQTLLFRDCSKLIALPDSIGNLKHLRHLDLSWTGIEKLPDTICALHELHTLVLSQTRIEKLPDTICDLHELHTLNLSSTRIEKLPDTICDLHELHTLDLRCCKNLSCLPTNITTLTHLRHLKISSTRNTMTQLPQLSNLKNLECLEEFVVGKNGEGLNIRELGKFQYLCGSLRIKRLESVENVGDVSEANLKDKNRITYLDLVWNDESDDSVKTREILNRLRPHTNLEMLRIENYRSTNFPDWVGHHSFSCLTSVSLIGCKNCYFLPALGQLPSLKELFIIGFDMVERIAEEFYYNGSSSGTKPPFKSLTRMTFSDMPRWKEWLIWGSDDDEEGGVLSKVEYLILSNCEMINGACLPDNLPSLKDLRIWGRNQLLGSLSTCHYPSLCNLSINWCGEVESFPQGTLPSTITHIDIWSCQNLVSLSEEGWPSNLKSLDISRCGKLFAVSNINKWNIRSVTWLTTLTICDINEEVVDPFPEEGQLPTTLTSFLLRNLRRLKSLNGAFLKHTSLEYMSVMNCKQLQGLPEERLPASLSRLEISDCPLLKPRCQRETGEDWDKISHIPNIQIDGRQI